MRVADDGHGFEANRANGQQGIGLLSMAERVRLLGGSFEVRSSADAGTVAVVSLPTGEGPCDPA
jgi:two-component system sensor histidine kinase UhpB